MGYRGSCFACNNKTSANSTKLPKNTWNFCNSTIPKNLSIKEIARRIPSKNTPGLGMSVEVRVCLIVYRYGEVNTIAK